jgi:hypothetical protein
MEITQYMLIKKEQQKDLLKMVISQCMKLVPLACSSWTHGFTDASASDLQIRLAGDWLLLDLSRIPRTWRPIVSSTAAVVFTTSKRIFKSLLLAFCSAYLYR